MTRKSRTNTEAEPKVAVNDRAASKALMENSQVRISKRACLAAMLAAPEGASIAEIGAALAWQPHTVRAALSTLRKSGTMIERIAPASAGDATRYRVTEAAEGDQ